MSPKPSPRRQQTRPWPQPQPLTHSRPPSPSPCPAHTGLFGICGHTRRSLLPAPYRAVVSRHYLDRPLECLGRVQRPQLAPSHLRTSACADAPNRSHRNLGFTAHRYRGAIKISLRHLSPQPAPALPLSLPLPRARCAGNHFKPGSTSISCPPAPLPRLLGSTAPDRDFVQLLVPPQPLVRYRPRPRSFTSSLENPLPPAEWRGLHPHAARLAALTARQPRILARFEM